MVATTLSSTSTPPSTASSTASAAYQPTPSAAAFLPSVAPGISDCPTANLSTYEPPAVHPISTGSGLYFIKWCGFDSTGTNIADAYVPTFDHCISMCSDWNLNYYGVTSSDQCVAAVFSIGNGSTSGYSYANCWIKNGNHTIFVDQRDTALLNVLD